jgi:hypothetical protein
MMAADTQEDGEKTYRAIGRFIFEFSLVEFVIKAELEKEIGLDKKHRAVVDSYDVGVLCTVAKKVFTGANAARIEGLINQFHTLNAVRIRVVHGVWIPYEEGGTVLHIARSSLTRKRSARQAEELEKHANTARALLDEFQQAFKDRRPK